MEFSSWVVLIWIICSVIGIGCFWIVLNDKIKHYSNQIDVVGRIVDFKRKDRKRYNSYVAVMEYSIDNKTYQNEADFIQLSEEEMLKFDKDKPICLSVDKQDHNRFRRTASNEDVLLAGTYLGSILCFFTMMLFFIVANCGLFVAP
jgi:hypothetical protein